MAGATAGGGSIDTGGSTGATSGTVTAVVGIGAVVGVAVAAGAVPAAAVVVDFFGGATVVVTEPDCGVGSEASTVESPRPAGSGAATAPSCWRRIRSSRCASVSE